MARPKTAPFGQQPKDIQRGIERATRRYKTGCLAVWRNGKMRYVPKGNVYAALKLLGYHIVTETIATTN